ncbi:MAG TPA: methyltransferase [Chitinophagaceae bacterium]
MSNPYFQFKQFIIHQDRCAMKVTTDSCLFGSWVAERVRNRETEVGRRESLAENILDIGTGTGLLSLMIAQQCNADITTVEIDPESFEQASENIAASPWADRINIFQADIRKFEFSSHYNVIISNAPFYEKELKGDNTKKNIAHHNEGLLLAELLTIIKKNLQPDGVFFLLLPFKRNEEIRKLIIGTGLSIRQLTFVRQSTKHAFFRIMLEGKLKTDVTSEIMIDEISIENDPSLVFTPVSRGSEIRYTAAFINLLKDFYLHL